MHRQLRKTLTVAFALAACGKPAIQPSPAVEQLTCGDSSMPQAKYARAVRATRSDSLSGIAVVLEDSSHRHLKAADVQAWGPAGGSGGPGDPSGITTFADRNPGLYSLRLRLEASGPRWIYAATLRPSYVDTVIVTVGTRCTLIWRGD
jgi:hypothetical protein